MGRVWDEGGGGARVGLAQGGSDDGGRVVEVGTVSKTIYYVILTVVRLRLGLHTRRKTAVGPRGVEQSRTHAHADTGWDGLNGMGWDKKERALEPDDVRDWNSSSTGSCGCAL